MEACKGNLYVAALDLYRFLISPQDGPYRATIMEPLGKMNAYFPVVNEHITKRNKKVTGSTPVSLPTTCLNGFIALRLRCRTEQTTKGNRETKRRPNQAAKSPAGTRRSQGSL